MGICALAPAEKKVLTEKVGEVLVKKNGKKKTYSVDEVKSAARDAKFPLDWDCWALSLYCDRIDFDSYHQTIGEICNFDFMHGKMLEAVSTILPNFDIVSATSTISDAIDTSWFSDLLDVFSNGPDLS